MITLNEGDTVFEIELTIKTCEVERRPNGFVCGEVSTQGYGLQRVFKDKNEGIDAMIKKLESLKQ